jgi:chromosome segregation and condensation protein ScpB
MTTKQQAEEKGLFFTGIFSQDKREMKTRISEEQKERPKAHIVLVSSTDGWYVYADETYAAYEHALALLNNN